MMICSKCNKEAKSGKVCKGDFVCDPCLKKDREAQKAGAIHTRYKLVSGDDGFFIAHATYRETKNFYVLVEVGPERCRWIEKESKGWRGWPGGASPQNVCQQDYEYRLEQIKRIEDNLKYHREQLATLEKFCQDQNIVLSKPKEPEKIEV